MQNKHLNSSALNWRQIKDKLLYIIVTLGGVSVLLTLLVLFCYLFYVVKPVFEPVEVEFKTSISNDLGQIISSGFYQQENHIWLLNKSGELKAYEVASGRLVAENKIEQFASDSRLIVAENNKNLIAALTAEQQLTIYQVITPDSHQIELKELASFEQLTTESEALDHISFTVNEAKDQVLFAWQHKNTIKTVAYRLKQHLLSEQDNWDKLEQNLVIPKQAEIQAIHVGSHAARIFVVTLKQILVFDSLDLANIKLIASAPLTAEPKASLLLPGASSLLLQYPGKVEQWFEANNANGRAYVQVRAFDSLQNSLIFTEHFRRVFAVFSALQTPTLKLFHSTSENLLAEVHLTDIPSKTEISEADFSFTGRKLVLSSSERVFVYQIDNPHPEVNFTSLWQKIWYENYPEPDYVWQSGAYSDEFEAKFSLMPLTLGTVKSALYGMLFSIPLAIAAAIYTAFFMSSTMRAKVKPVIETMEALPTVILGFMAGLWLAPLIESYLFSLILLFFLAPLVVLSAAAVWFKIKHLLPTKIQLISPVLLLMPVLMVFSCLVFATAEQFNVWLFNGNVRLFINTELGWDYEQRNALVVAIAMGFAVIPTVFTIAEDAIYAVPKRFTEASLALGATRWQTMCRVVLLIASPGIFSAMMLGFSRAVGETMIVLMATGNTPIMDWSILEGMRTLAANIAIELPEADSDSSHYRILFLSALVLLVFSFFFNTLADLVRHHLRQRYSRL
ncbi:ABC transporter permease subunit [Gayadomonas joobiniege]|uniref:ABC transporter permease subunit n=1 Tax=Gayadomonas joobiniege TaxID=1234606 RepID=UPI00035E49CE|nr:ABC transporter permease subunit [Gayadomonas joobiniege]